jgi:hypothetical protein
VGTATTRAIAREPTTKIDKRHRPSIDGITAENDHATAVTVTGGTHHETTRTTASVVTITIATAIATAIDTIVAEMYS